MAAIKKTWIRFLGEESGVTAIQYSLIAILCSVAIVAGLYGVRGALNDGFGDASSNLQSATN